MSKPASHSGSCPPLGLAQERTGWATATLAVGGCGRPTTVGPVHLFEAMAESGADSSALKHAPPASLHLEERPERCVTQGFGDMRGSLTHAANVNRQSSSAAYPIVGVKSVTENLTANRYYQRFGATADVLLGGWRGKPVIALADDDGDVAVRDWSSAAIVPDARNGTEIAVESAPGDRPGVTERALVANPSEVGGKRPDAEVPVCPSSTVSVRDPDTRCGLRMSQAACLEECALRSASRTFAGKVESLVRRESTSATLLRPQGEVTC